MRTAIWMVAAALALPGCSVKGGLSDLTGRNSSSSSSSNAPAERHARDVADNEAAEDRARRRDAERAQEERDKEAGYDARAKAFAEMVVVEPANGMPKVGAIDIDWCDLVPATQNTGRSLYRSMTSAVERGWSMGHIPQIAANLCINPSDPQYREQAGYFLQAWVNMSGLSPKRMHEHIKLRLRADEWEKQRQAHCKTLEVSSEASETDKVLGTARRQLFGCHNDDAPVWFGGRPDYYSMDEVVDELDRTGERPSQELVAYRVQLCVNPKTDGFPADEMIRFAACRVDLDALSEKALEAEARKAGYNDFALAVMRENQAFARLHVARFQAQADALAAKDKDWKALFAVPAVAQKQWEKTWTRHEKALRAAAAYEATYYGPSRKAARGCGDELRGHLRDYLRSSRPKDADSARAAVTDEVGVQLLVRLAACELAEGNKMAARSLSQLADKARASRGPRAAVYYAMVEKLAEIKADRARFPVGPADLGHSPKIPLARHVHMQTINIPGEEDKGVVASVKAEGNGVVLTFKKERWKEPAQICEDTSKIWRIDESGRVLYFKKCRANGFETMEHTAKTIWVPKVHAAGIKAGSFVRFEFAYGEQAPGNALFGMVREVYASKKQNKLVNFYGLEL
jgi:hypothetical protein